MLACEKCGKERAGSVYQFRPGNMTSTSVRLGNVIRTTTHYRIMGPVFTNVCDECVDERIRRNRTIARWIMTPLVALSAWGLVAGIVMIARGTGGVALTIFTGICTLLFGAGLVASLSTNITPANRRSTGEALAIELRRPWLKQQGWKKVWNTAAYKQIEALRAKGVLHDEIGAPGTNPLLDELLRQAREANRPQTKPPEKAA